MGKNNKIDITLLTGNNKVEDIKLEAYVTHIESEKTAEAWGMYSRQQCKDESNGRYYQFVSPMSYKPLKIYRGGNGSKSSDKSQEESVVDNVAAISSQTEDEEMVFLGNRQSKDSRLLWIGIALAVVALTFLIAIWIILNNRAPEPAVSMALAVTLPFVSKGNKNKLKETSIRELQKNANAMVIDEKTKKRTFRHLEGADIPSDSFEKEYKGKIFHILGKDLDGKYWPIDIPREMTSGEAPVDLYVAKHCAEEVEEVFGLSTSTMQRIKIGVFVVLIIMIVIFTFLVVTASSGGTIQ